jgi:hypothetical protein
MAGHWTAWLLAEDGRRLLPSRAADCRQRQTMDSGVHITTETDRDGLALTSRAWVELESDIPVCKLHLQARTDANAWLVLALRPQNPEGISFIHRLSLSKDRHAWTVDGTQRVTFSTAAERHHVSDYRRGDVAIHLKDLDDQSEGHCNVGMVTAAALFPVKADEGAEVTVTIPLADVTSEILVADAWNIVHRDHCRLICPEPR